MQTELEQAEKNDSETYLSPAALGMTVLALVSFGFCGNALFLTFTGSLILLSQLVSWRLQKGSAEAWGARTLLIGSVLLATIMSPTILQSMLYFVLYLHLIALLCAGEIVLQCWQSPATTQPREAGLVLLSGIIFLAASTKMDFHNRHIWYLTPAYVLTTVLTLRRFRVRTPRTFIRRILTGKAGLLAFTFALAIGFGVSVGVDRYRDDLSRWFIQLMSAYRPQDTSGFSTRPKLGKVFQMRQSPRRVLKVTGAQEPLHLRGVAYDDYEEGSWGKNLESRHSLPLNSESIKAPKIGRRVSISHLVEDHRFFFLPLNSAGLESPPNVLLEYSSEDGGPLRPTPALRLPFEYTAILSEAPDYQGFLCTPKLEFRNRFHLLQRPEHLDLRIYTLAQEIISKADSPQAKIKAVEDYLKSHHEYSLSIDPGEGDPIENFLLKGKSAHCEYFASAATLLLRCAGIPTRYVTGYVAHNKNEAGEIIVRERDAHAWAESYLDGIGWVTVEATPGSGCPEKGDTSLPLWTQIWEWLQDTFTAVRDWLSDLTPTETISILGGIGVAFGLLQVWLQWRSKQTALNALRLYDTRSPDFLRMAAEFEAELTRRGKECPGTLTWQEWIDSEANALADPELATVSDLNPAEKNKQSALIQEFILLYNRLRFGHSCDATPLTASIGQQQKQDWERLKTLLQTLQTEKSIQSINRPTNQMRKSS